jgi:hypothetical protein
MSFHDSESIGKDAPTVRAQIAAQKQRLRLLQLMQDTIRSYEVFDDEDFEFIEDAIQQESQVDEELLALQERLPVRQSILQELDQRYDISGRFPDLMRKFVEKDADLYTLLVGKQATATRRK